MLERDSMPQTDNNHSAISAEQSVWGKGSHMYGADLFGAGEMPETYTAHVRPLPLLQLTTPLSFATPTLHEAECLLSPSLHVLGGMQHRSASGCYHTKAKAIKQ